MRWMIPASPRSTPRSHVAVPPRARGLGRPLSWLGALAMAALVACGPPLSEEEAEALDRADVPHATLGIQSIPTGYYDGATGKTGTTLLAALSSRIAAGQRTMSYDAARDQLFGAADDTDNDDVVFCVYTGRKAERIRDRGTASGASMNTEHVWPQSLGATGGAQADLHHLRGSDIDTNGRRGNYPFGVVVTATWTAPAPDGAAPSRLGKDAGGRTVFEPHDSTKGDIARSIMYFYTRYNGQPTSKYTTNNFKVEKSILRKWHEMDPPDATERLRNDVVFSIQGNRNPYIDHPEYVAAIPDFN